MRKPTWTATSLLKKVFRQGERSLSKEEILQRLQEAYTHELSATGSDGLTVLRRALNSQNSPFQKGASEAIVQFNGNKSKILDHAYAILKEIKRPLSEEKLKQKLRQRGVLHWHQMKKPLPLEQDPRFVQLESDGRWMPTEWRLANDKVFEYALSRQAFFFPLEKIPEILKEMGLSQHEYIFILDGDERFSVEEGHLRVRLQSEQARISKEEKGVEEMQLMQSEQTAQTTQTAQTPPATPETKTVLQEVLYEIKQAIQRLRQRNEEMKREVIDSFQQDDMRTIERLMAEKRKNETAYREFAALLEKLERAETANGEGTADG
ncbi:hypothetical protein BSNK01_08700 [Bacillaceae bacterium]